MLKEETKRSITKGIVKIFEDNFEDISYEKATFTKACSVNTLYIWNNPVGVVKKVFEILEPGAQFVVAFEDINQLEKRKLSDDVFQLYTVYAVKKLLTSAGFLNGVRIETRKKRKLSFHCAVSIK